MDVANPSETLWGNGKGEEKGHDLGGGKIRGLLGREGVWGGTPYAKCLVIHRTHLPDKSLKFVVCVLEEAMRLCSAPRQGRM